MPFLHLRRKLGNSIVRMTDDSGVSSLANRPLGGSQLHYLDELLYSMKGLDLQTHHERVTGVASH